MGCPALSCTARGSGAGQSLTGCWALVGSQLGHIAHSAQPSSWLSLSRCLFICWVLCPTVSLSVYPYVSQSVCLAVPMSVCLFVCPSVCLSLPLSVLLSLSVCPSVPLSFVTRSVCLSAPLSVSLSICTSVCVSLRLFVFPSAWRMSQTRVRRVLRNKTTRSGKEMCGKNRRKNTQNAAAKNCKPGGNRYRNEDGEREIKRRTSGSNHRQQRPQNDDGRWCVVLITCTAMLTVRWRAERGLHMGGRGWAERGRRGLEVTENGNSGRSLQVAVCSTFQQGVSNEGDCDCDQEADQHCVTAALWLW